MAENHAMTELPSPAHFVLVHGASFGGWCWYKVRCLLETNGHTVSCPDLKSAGIDPSDPDTIFSFAEYSKPLDDILAALPTGQKVILVGHSAGGLNVTEVIYNFPEKIQVAVFVGAAMLRNGLETEQDINIATPDLSKYGDVCELFYGQGRDNPPTSVVLKKEAQREILSQMSPLEQKMEGKKNSVLVFVLLVISVQMLIGKAQGCQDRGESCGAGTFSRCCGGHLCDSLVVGNCYRAVDHKCGAAGSSCGPWKHTYACCGRLRCSPTWGGFICK